MRDEMIGALSLAAKAGKVFSGEGKAEQHIRAGDAVFCLIAADASDNTKKKFINMCRYRGIPYQTASDRNRLGAGIGKGLRSVVVITDENFSRLVRSKLERSETWQVKEYMK